MNTNVSFTPPRGHQSTRTQRRMLCQTTGLLVLAGAGFLAGCHKPATKPSTSEALPPAVVQVAVARVQSAPVLLSVTGVVRPVQRAQLAAKVMGAITDLPVVLGQRVHSGDVLARISAAEISARVLQAQSQLNVARRDLERERDLLTKGASTADMVKGLEDRLALTEAMVREAEAMLSYTIVRAPFDGVITRKQVNAGDLAAPGAPLIEIEGTNAFEVEAALPDSLTGGLAAGQSLGVAVPGARQVFSGVVTELSPAADPSAHTVMARIAVPSGVVVRSGQFARVEVPGGPVARLLVPASAILPAGQLERVFVAGTDNRAMLRLVKTGAARDGMTEVLSGLDDGERVIVQGGATLREGQSLTITSQPGVQPNRGEANTEAKS